MSFSDYRRRRQLQPFQRRDGDGGERKNFEELLEMMDTDKDGKLSKTETKGPLKEDFSKVDKNNDGFITKDELGKEPKKK